MGELFDKLSTEDKNKIDFYLKNYVSDVDGYSPAKDDYSQLSYILRVWDSDKSNLFNLFGKELILSKDYEYSRSEEEIIESIQKNNKTQTFFNALLSTYSHSRAIRRISFIDDEEYRSYKAYYDNMPFGTCGKPGHIKRYMSEHFGVSYESLGTNRCERDYIFITKDGKIIEFPKGSKYMRMLGKISDMLGMKEQFEEFRLYHSLELNTKKLVGKLCISIHPLDFMTMSDNDSGWSSCMSWQENGCYRMGTVEMMNSPCVVVAYLCANEDMKFWNGFTWNNKKWRNLFVVDQDVITEVKPYPYRRDEITDTVLHWLNELTGKKYSDEIFEFSSGENRYKDMYRIKAECNKMYNDFASCQHRALVKSPIPIKLENKVRVWHFNYSGKTECMCCGAVDEPYDFEADGLVCRDCSQEESECCDICGRNIYVNSDDSYYWDDYREVYVCYNCFQRYYQEDELTGDNYHEDDMITVYFAAVRDNPTCDDYCIRTRDSVTSDWGKYQDTPVHYDRDNGLYYVNIDECGPAWLRCVFNNDNDIIDYTADLSPDEEHDTYDGRTFVSINGNAWWAPASWERVAFNAA